MRLIINGYQFDNHIEVLNQFLSERGDIGFLSYICEKSNVLKSIIPEIYYINWVDASLGRYNFDGIEPLDEPLIESMRDCECIVLKMIDRHESQRHIDYSDRLQLYYNHLRFWNHIIKDKRIDTFISQNIPHESYDFVIYSLCKLYGIKCIITHQGPVSDTFFYMDDWKTFMPLMKNQDGLEGIELNKSFKTYIDNQLSEQENSKPFYMDAVEKKQRNIKEKIKHKIDSFIIRYASKVEIDVEREKLSKFYNRNLYEIKEDDKFVYFPLHYQPELTTSPLGGVFVNQLLVAQMLAYHLPENVKIYVKEHPNQDVYGRSLNFLKELIRIDNVCLIDTEFDSFQLIKKSKAVVTVTGTAGLEALFRKKPVMLFGNFFYQYAKGVFSIKSNNDCKVAVEQIFNDDYCPSKEDIINFMKAYQRESYHGYVDNYYSKISLLDDSENNAELFKFLQVTTQ